MNVKELIAELSKYPEELHVIVRYETCATRDAIDVVCGDHLVEIVADNL